PGWHLYAASSSQGIPASFKVSPAEIAQSTRVFETKPKRYFDQTYGAQVETYEGEAAFVVETQVAANPPPGPAPLAVDVTYQTCSDPQCVPGNWTGQAAVAIDPAAPASVAIPANFIEAKPSPPGAPATAADTGLAQFLLVAFGVGLACIFTPCVFP